MIDLHGKAVHLLLNLSDRDKELLKENIKQYEVYKGIVPDIYYPLFVKEIKNLLNI